MAEATEVTIQLRIGDFLKIVKFRYDPEKTDNFSNFEREIVQKVREVRKDLHVTWKGELNTYPLVTLCFDLYLHMYTLKRASQWLVQAV